MTIPKPKPINRPGGMSSLSMPCSTATATPNSKIKATAIRTCLSRERKSSYSSNVNGARVLGSWSGWFRRGLTLGAFCFSIRRGQSASHCAQTDVEGEGPFLAACRPLLKQRVQGPQRKAELRGALAPTPRPRTSTPNLNRRRSQSSRTWMRPEEAHGLHASRPRSEPIERRQLPCSTPFEWPQSAFQPRPQEVFLDVP